MVGRDQRLKTGQISLKDYDLSALRHIEIGAQPVPYILLEDSKKFFPNLPIANIYGITEGGGGGLTNCYDEDIMRNGAPSGRRRSSWMRRLSTAKGRRCPRAAWASSPQGPRLMKEYAFNPK
jgi:acyl-coenzyme A synthetase/AMP-(fatty) acid ligase